MELINIIHEWRKDSTLDVMDLGGEAIKIPKLHCKYYEFFIKEKVQLEKMKIEYKDLENLMFSYYSGTLSVEELKQHGFDRLDLKVLRQDIPRFLEGDPKIIAYKKQMAVQSEKVDFLKSILDQVKGRSFIIRDAIEWEKFKQGN